MLALAVVQRSLPHEFGASNARTSLAAEQAREEAIAGRFWGRLRASLAMWRSSPRGGGRLARGAFAIDASRALPTPHLSHDRSIGVGDVRDDEAHATQSHKEAQQPKPRTTNCLPPLQWPRRVGGGSPRGRAGHGRDRVSAGLWRSQCGETCGTMDPRPTSAELAGSALAGTAEEVACPGGIVGRAGHLGHELFGSEVIEVRRCGAVA